MEKDQVIHHIYISLAFISQWYLTDWIEWEENSYYFSICDIRTEFFNKRIYPIINISAEWQFTSILICVFFFSLLSKNVCQWSEYQAYHLTTNSAYYDFLEECTHNSILIIDSIYSYCICVEIWAVTLLILIPTLTHRSTINNMCVTWA